MAQAPLIPDPAAPGFWQSDEPHLLWNPRLPAPWGDAPPLSVIPAGHLAFATSGTSGPPKLLCLSRSALLASAAAVNKRLNVSAADTWLRALPLFHVGGIGIHARSHLSSCRVVVDAEKWDAQRVVSLMATERVTIASAVPTQVHDLVSAGLRAPECLRVLLTGGAALAPDLQAGALALGWPVHATYGLTEAASSVAIASIPGGPMEMLPHLHARISARGTLELSGAALFSGQLIPGAAGEAWSFQPRAGEWHETSDLASLAESDGLAPRVLSIHGRSDRTLKIRGELVNLDALESLLPGGCALLARESPRSGHELVIFTERPASCPDLAAACGDFPPYARVSEIVPVPQLPCTVLGKLDRRALEALTAAVQGLRVPSTSSLPHSAGSSG